MFPLVTSSASFALLVAVPKGPICKVGGVVQVVFDACWRRLEEEHKDVRARHVPLAPVQGPAVNYRAFDASLETECVAGGGWCRPSSAQKRSSG